MATTTLTVTMPRRRRRGCCGCRSRVDSEDEGAAAGGAAECRDRSADRLSHVGAAAYERLRWRHWRQHHQLWNVTSGRFVALDPTPREGWRWAADPEDGHSDWFPHKVAALLARTERWADVLSLGAPDGLFLTAFNAALRTLAARKPPAEGGGGADDVVVVRMMFANIIGMPLDCHRLIRRLTEGVPKDGALRLWVGAWRRGMSWNHAKIVAVDGRCLHTGGHNLWDRHYLRSNPVHDLSLELEGRCARDGHRFADAQWRFVERIQRTACGRVVDRLPDYLPLLARTRVTVSEFPPGVAPEFPPLYSDRAALVAVAAAAAAALERPRDRSNHINSINDHGPEVPVLTLGRYGTLLSRARPSDDAIHAMLDAARSSIRLAIQDLGPVCIPGTKIPLLGCVWPRATLDRLGRALYERNVHVDIALSNPGSVPGGLRATEACYGNGWSCVDVAAEILKGIRRRHSDADAAALARAAGDRLRVCVVRQQRGNAYGDGGTIGMHAKHFIVDDICTYIGSQNLYICDLAEWGTAIDDAATTRRIKAEYWDPMWAASYDPDDCDLRQVLTELDVDRDGHGRAAMDQRRQWMAQARAQSTLRPGRWEAMRQGQLGPSDRDVAAFYDESRSEKESAPLAHCAKHAI